MKGLLQGHEGFGQEYFALQSWLFFDLMAKLFLTRVQRERETFPPFLLLMAVLLLFLGMVFLQAIPAVAGKNRMVREDSDGDGKMDRGAHLNDDGTLMRLEIDRNGDGRFEVVQSYDKGILFSVETDTNGDGVLNERDFFEKERRVRHEKLNADGQKAEVVSFDSRDRVQLWQRDTTGDGKMDTEHHYKEEMLVEITRDTNGDGKVDIWERYEKEALAEQKTDSNGDGRVDQVVFYHQNGEAIRSLHDADGNGTLESTRYYKDGKSDRQERDENQDSRPDMVIRFDALGNVASAESDTNGDSQPDTWQHYEKGKVVRLDQDRNHDGKADISVAYSSDKMVRTLLDTTGDGKFDTVQRHDDPAWSTVTEVDRDGDGRIDERLFYTGDMVRLKEGFHPETGVLVVRVEYDEEGRIRLSEEAGDGAQHLNLTWRYDENGNAVLAEKDRDGDGKPDIWYHYQHGNIVRLEEDRNRDGKPDLWQTYEGSQNPTSQREDMDFDGVVDVERQP